MAQFLTTEHFVLQTAMSATIADGNGRTSLFLGSVSSGVVALALVAQVSDVGPAFYGFAAILLPVLFFLGLVTCFRLVTTSIEYWIYSRSIQRVRRFYVDAAPEIVRYLAFPPAEDFDSATRARGIKRSRVQVFMTLAGSVAVITAAIGGVFTGLAVGLLAHAPAAVAGGSGVAGFLLITFVLLRSQSKRFLTAAQADFPTSETD